MKAINLTKRNKQMKKLLKLVITPIIVMAVLSTGTGCTVLAHKSNEREVYGQYAKRSADPKVLRAYQQGDFVGMGIDLTKADIIFHSPTTVAKQLGGVVLDVGAAYGLKEVYDKIVESTDGDNDSNSSPTSVGRDNINLRIEGTGNNINYTNTRAAQEDAPVGE